MRDLKDSSLISDTAKERIAHLPLLMSYVVCMLLDIIDNIINGKCDEDVMVSTISTLNNNANGRYCKDDLVSFEKAAEVLSYGRNRVALKSLLDKHGIKQVVMNNHKVGYVRSEIMALRDSINEDIRNREVAQQFKSERKSKRKKLC